MNPNYKRSRLPAVLGITVALLIQLILPSALLAQPAEVKTFQFKKTATIKIKVLSKQAFEQKFAANPLIPKTNESIIQLAQKLYTPATREEILTEECGEELFGALFAALSNPDISDATRDQVDALVDAFTPNLPDVYTSGHFKFYYTTSDTDPNNNVTLEEIKATATILNNAWNNYVTNFTTPKHYVVSGGCCADKKMIDVKVYYLGSTLYGSTSSSWDHINLNSKYVVKDTCKRKTTPVHELFHRVQYSYGYVTGTANMSWAVEGTAAWSQKYKAPQVGDWMTRMNSGLNAPDRQLVSGRSYNACHFWCYLGQRGQGEVATINQVWSTFSTNGNDMPNAVQSTIVARVTGCNSFDQFAQWWNFANFYKDASNADAKYDYEEDEWTRTCDGVNYGPLTSVPRTSLTLNIGSNITQSSTVSPYGADYFEFAIGNTVTQVDIDVTTTATQFGYAVIELKNNAVQNYDLTPAGGMQNYNYTKNFTAGALSHIVLMVVGNPDGGTYTVTASSN